MRIPATHATTINIRIRTAILVPAFIFIGVPPPQPHATSFPGTRGRWTSQRAGRVLVPARVPEVFRLVTDLQDGEHPPHPDGTKRTIPCHHREGVRRTRHSHFRHLAHPALSHRHV